jgi:hypothetical protein
LVVSGHATFYHRAHFTNELLIWPHLRDKHAIFLRFLQLLAQYFGWNGDTQILAAFWIKPRYINNTARLVDAPSVLEAYWEGTKGLAFTVSEPGAFERQVRRICKALFCGRRIPVRQFDVILDAMIVNKLHHCGLAMIGWVELHHQFKLFSSGHDISSCV